MEQKIILLADDDIDDTEMFCEALTNIDDNLICHCSTNGNDLFTKLNEISKNPDLIFLDLNMPVLNGWQCLKILKEDQRFKDIPVIMISTSSHKGEIATAMDLGALCYFVKPNSFKEFTHILEEITENLGPNLKNAVINLQKSGSGNIFTGNEMNEQ